MGFFLVSGALVTIARAQPSPPNACLETLSDHGLPVEGLADVALTTDLHDACEAQRALPVDGIDAGATGFRTAYRRLLVYRRVLSALAGIASSCEGRCELVRRVLLSLLLERLVNERYEYFSSMFIEDAAIAAALPGGISRSVALESYERARALARSAGLRALERALAARRNGVSHPLFPGTTCARFAVEESPARAAPTRRPRALLVYGSELVHAPLSEAEQMRVTDAVREAMEQRTGLTAIPAPETDALVREARLGRALGAAACAAPLQTEEALSDARPDALIVRVELDCGDAGCKVRVFAVGDNVAVPDGAAALVAPLRGPPERVDTWLDATRTLALPPPSPEFVDVLRGGSEGGRRLHVDVYGAGLTAELVRAALDPLLPTIASCTPGTSFLLRAVLDVAPSGEVHVVRTDAESTSLLCRQHALERARFAAGSGPRRVLVELGIATRTPTEEPFRSTEPRGVQFGAFSIADARLGRRHYDYMRAISAAVATCDVRRVTRGAPLPASVQLAIDGRGHVTRARVTTSDSDAGACLERELSVLGTQCPRERRPTEIRYEICSFAP